MVSPVVFFDGDCGLCSRVVRFIYRHEKKAKISFSPLQSDFAIKILAKNNIKPDLNTFYFYYNDTLTDRSSGVLKIIPFLKWYFSFLLIFWIFPKFIRDYFYNLIAKNRLKIYKDVCSYSPELNKRIIKK